MKVRREKAMRIINSLIAFCHSEGAIESHIDLRCEGDKTLITVSAPIENLAAESYDDLVQELNLPRQHEVEQNYWELGGELETHSDLTLVGMMVDEAEIAYRDGVLKIHVWRYD